MTAMATDEQPPSDQVPHISSDAAEEPTQEPPAHMTSDTGITLEQPSHTDALSPNGAHDITPEPAADPKISALLAMFPDFDTTLLQSVLESVAGDQDKAVDLLLAMSDPSYTSTARADTAQTELDEEIARRLMLEETERQAAYSPRNVPGNYPHQTWTGGAYTPSGDRQQQPAEADGMTQFQEQLGKLAETGKKTFNTFLSKVKAKMQEFDNSSSSNNTRPLPGGDSWSTSAQSHSYYEPHSPSSAQGYDAGPTNFVSQPRTLNASRPVTDAQPMTLSTSEAAPPSAAPAPSPAGNVDPSKLGLLPKRPVSLGSSAQPSRNLADDEDVEYVENPFEESTRR